VVGVTEVVLEMVALGGGPWPTLDPFLFCVNHDDRYPAGNAALGPAASLSGRDIGQDFSGKDGWNMYHGDVVPGFPQHPHRGFETITAVRDGVIDHSDSLGAAARFGAGDVQWMTAGAGIVHSEMFPLIESDRPNPMRLFQIWMNLPRADKMVAPHFTMFWDEQVPHHRSPAGEPGVDITVIAGSLHGLEAPPPPPHSWASRPEADVAIWHVRLAPGASVTLPAAASAATNRMLYVFDGEGLLIGDERVGSTTGAAVRSDVPLPISGIGNDMVQVLLLQGRPIGEPVAQYGPFVMNDRAGVEQAFRDYQATQFGGWPWPDNAPTHPRDRGRFARHTDGRIDEPAVSRAL
jgi:quercetin 2,3-dioxygenase